MIEIKCTNCGKVLAKGLIKEGSINIHCNRCGTVHNVEVVPKDTRIIPLPYSERMKYRTK